MAYCSKCGKVACYEIPTNDTKMRLVCGSCGYIHYDNPKVVTGVLALYDGRILLCRRAIEPQYGFWTLPAGFLEIGESMADGAIRETQEEADGISENLKLYTLINLPDLGQIHTFYLADLKDGKFGCGTESLVCQLFEVQDIPWSELSFDSVRYTLTTYVADLQKFGTPNKVKAMSGLHETTLLTKYNAKYNSN